MAVRQNAEPFGQPLDASSVDAGMNVISHDGEQLGVVRDVWAYVPRFGYVAKSRFAVASYGPVRGTAHHFEGADALLQVKARHGMRRENEQDLYIPLDSVRDTVPGEAIIVEHTMDDAHGRFAGRPGYLDENRAR